MNEEKPHYRADISVVGWLVRCIFAYFPSFEKIKVSL
jgi:hypothetical protein